MPVTFDPHLRLQHLESYVRNVHRNIPLEEARIQLLRCRLVGYSLVADLAGEGYSAESIDSMMAEVYRNLRETYGEGFLDPYEDPCASQFRILDELRSYTLRERSDPFMAFIRAEFRKVFVPTLRLLTDLCASEKKYSWEEVKAQLQEIMEQLEVPIDWEECEFHLRRYLEKIDPIVKEKIRKLSL